MAELVRKKPKKELRSPRHYRTEVAVRRLQQDQSYAMISF